MQSLREGLSVIAVRGNVSPSPQTELKQCDGPCGKFNRAVEDGEDNPRLCLDCSRPTATEGATRGVNNREGGRSRSRAWYDRSVENLYRTVIPEKFGDETDRFRF
jgi:hypothetical protein